MTSLRLRLAISLLALAAAGAGCGNGSGTAADGGVKATGSGTTESSTTDVSDPSTTSPSTTNADDGGAFAVTTVSTPPARRGLLASVKATADGNIDRVTFEFEGELPGYRIGFVDRPVVQDGSGEEIQVAGAAVLEVHFEPASGFDLSGGGRQVYKGPVRLDLSTRTVVDVTRTGDFEAVLAWAIGLDTKVPFRVRTATAPNRVIVEVGSGS